jgi:hypothetical protein
LSRIVSQQIGQVTGRDDIVQSDNFDFFAEQSLLNESPEYQTADPSKAVNSNFGHGDYFGG